MNKKIEEKLPGVKAKVPLKKYTTYKVGGSARYFFIAKNKEDLIKSVKAAKEFKLPVFILGGGSNLLVSDNGFNGLVVHIQNSEFRIRNSDEVYVEAGMDLTELAYKTAESGLAGIEWSAGIPGTVGGAIYGHAQAFGAKISDAVKTVEAIDIKSLKIKSFSRKQCQFSLKNSIFKKNKNLVIISAVLKFKKKSSKAVKRQIKENMDYRNARHPVNFPSAGSTFVNPEVKIKSKNLLMRFPELIEYNKTGVIPAGYLIKNSGLARKKIGKAQISEKHSNFIINLGGAEAKDILALIKLAKQKVKKTFGINLRIEVQTVGFKNNISK